jgi:membrane protein involved in colicin uptake
MTGQGLINNVCPPPATWFPAPSMSWVNPAFKLKDLIKTAEKMVEEDKKREFAAAEAVRLAAELKVKQEAEARAAAELKVKLEAEAMAAAELKAKQEAEAKAAALKKTTITCVKGKLTKKVTAVKPKCPSGYKLKK